MEYIQENITESQGTIMGMEVRFEIKVKNEVKLYVYRLLTKTLH